MNPSLAFRPPTEFLLSCHRPKTSYCYKVRTGWLLWVLCPYSTYSHGSPQTKGCRPCPFRFQGLVTLLTVSFSQNLWPIFQSQALMGFALQSFCPPKDPDFFRSRYSLAVNQQTLPVENLKRFVAPASEFSSLWEAVLAKNVV